MGDPATARAQADQALQEAAVALKRQLGVTRRALQAVRQAQVNLFGIPVQDVPLTTQLEQGEQSDNSSQQASTEPVEAARIT